MRSSRCPSGRADKIGGLRDRHLTGEVLTDVDGRTPVDEVLSLQQWNVFARPEGNDCVRVEGGERGARDLGVRPADHRQFAGRGEVEIEGIQGVAER